MEPEQVKQNPEVKREDGKPHLEANSPHFPPPPSISSSSSSSLLDPDTIEEIHLDDASSKSEHDGNLSPRQEFISSPDITAPMTPQWSMVSASPPPSGFLLNSPMKSPTSQTMGRPTGYDPNRIPTSIFSTKASNPTEWSTASNESLFSIHMGNNSFSREHSVWLEEWNNAHGTEPKPNNEVSSSLPPVMEESSVRLGKASRLEKEESEKISSKGAAGPRTENHSKEKIAPPVEVVKGTPSDETNRNSSSTTHTSFSNPRLSGESGTSGSSFAFPVLVSDTKDGSSKVAVTEKPEKQQSQAQVPEPTPPPKASEKGWFSCFSCWPRCC
ncbi:hypothetical protein ACJIZ3_014735 [Penstemon smallii]|uniref:Uncharacterized protein n=1 Tax=Penstemon smallii TaxID=265156 RepID=A0ABD3RKF6_9LAMI